MRARQHQFEPDTTRQVLRKATETRYIPNVLELVRRNLRFFLLATVAGLLLRLLFLIRFPAVVADSFVYGDIAKNWLQHGIYGLSGTDEISPTYIRLPGYPAFLAFIFSIFGMEHYRAVLVTQIFLDIGTCFICADLARRLWGNRAARVAFVLAALCPFLANYSAAALTETLEIFFTALALDFAVSGAQRRNLRAMVGCGLSCAAAILLRPDGALLVICIFLYLLWHGFVAIRNARGTTFMWSIQAALLVCVIAVLPLVPWALRNFHVLHRFQPLAPRYANEEDEFVPIGFNHWTKSWIADYASVEEIYWAVPGSPIEIDKLPDRAFDNAQQGAQTEQVISAYNQLLHVSPELDHQFEDIASARRHSHPLRYYVDLPTIRILDMWLRPRTEMLPSDSRWWEFNDEPKWSALAVSFGVVGLFYVACALLGFIRNRRVAFGGLFLLFVGVRSLFLGTLENPEPRYTLEMYPVVIVFAAAALARCRESNRPNPAANQSF
jgi:4-amino-4-deoxy-L-arabinose transferase-like glycosyltransferase